VNSFAAGSLDDLKDLLQTQREPLARILEHHGLKSGTVGYDGGDTVQPFTYAAQNVYGSSCRAILGSAAPAAKLVDVCDTLNDARAVLTGAELDDLLQACGFAAAGFERAAARLQPGVTERRVAGQFRAAIEEACGTVARCGAFTFCMSGPNAAQVYAAYQLTRDRVLSPGDLALRRIGNPPIWRR
jgi:Xaa-Pro aminopeptidase